jgi:subtilisin family serine protease
MNERVLSLAMLAGRTGRSVRVAIIDSGVHVGHPHIGNVAVAIAFDDRGRQHADVVDRLGHGTAVAAVIHEKAPDAELLIAKVFDTSLAATGRALVAAIEWAIAGQAAIINLSLGTLNREHETALAEAVGGARVAGALVVAAAPSPERQWLPGGLPGVVGVGLDWTCDRDACCIVDDAGAISARASGYPRPIPGVSPERNLKGQSFAVANVSGLLVLACEPPRFAEDLFGR